MANSRGVKTNRGERGWLRLAGAIANVWGGGEMALLEVFGAFDPKTDSAIDWFAIGLFLVAGPVALADGLRRVREALRQIELVG
jgi:hypothetical protein